MDKITVVCHKDHDKGYEDFQGKCLLCVVDELMLEIGNLMIQKQRVERREWVGLTEWMPIETAPQNGTEVLVMYVHIDTQVVHNGFWLGANDTDDESDIGWWSYEHSEVSRIKLDDWMTPTHWLPLPTLKEKNT